jgi:beta-glucosidase
VTRYFIGSVLSGGGGNPEPNNPQAWAAMVRVFQEAALQTRLGIPILYGVDAVHGHSNVVGATMFPHNIGLGAADDLDLMERIGRITAREVIATHVHWDFAPAVSVPQDLRWGRTFEGYSENPDLVSRLGAAYTRGLQGGSRPEDLGKPDSVLASVKHFVGDGGTRWGSADQSDWVAEQRGWSEGQGIDQGVTDVDEATLRKIHLPPYIAAIAAGAMNIMVSYSSWGGLKMHAHKYLLTDVLKGELGFSGFLVSDWRAIDQIDPDYETCVVQSLNAGLDMIMVPFDYKRFIETLTRVVEKGAVSMERIDDAVRRILLVKFMLGVFEAPFGPEGLLDQFGAPEHRAVAREAAAKSCVLLKNEDAVLPLDTNQGTILLAGQAADDIGLQCGGWTVSWMGSSGATTPGTTLREALEARMGPEAHLVYAPDGRVKGELQADIGLVVLAEPPYAEGTGDRAHLNLSGEDIALLERVRGQCGRLVVVLYSGRPLIVTEQIDDWQAFVAAWLPGSEADGVVEVLVGDRPFTGRLSYTWPASMDQLPVGSSPDAPLFPLGFGLETGVGHA